MSALGSWSLISAGYLRVSAHFPFSFVSPACETEACCQPWSGEAGDLLQYEPQHIWGFKVSSHPSPTIQALSRLNTPSPSVAPLQIWNLLPQLSELKGKGENQRETLCRVAGLLVHFRATPGKTPMGEDKGHWDRLQCQGYVFWEVPCLHSSFYN